MSKERVYMIGIGGIGMSALAQLYHAQGAHVSGSDREASPTTVLLEEKGITVHIGENAEHIPSDVELVVYSDAVYPDHQERREVVRRGLKEFSYFEALGEVTKNHFTIAVAGSHGKTTTTAMLSKVLSDCGLSPTAIVGSLMADVRSNFIEGKVDGPFVVEACEYRDHLLKLSPSILVVTNLEWDHTDYFKSFDALKHSFIKAVSKLPKEGVLVVDMESAIGKELAEHASCTVVSYANEEVPPLALLGTFNEQNAKAAKAATRVYDATISEETIDASLASFKGTWRRFECIGNMRGGALVYDDYAHHPTEIQKTLAAVKEKFPQKKIIVAFHPHLYSRTHDLMDKFEGAFSDADEVIVAPIYPAREKPIPGVTSEALAERIAAHGTSATAGTFEEIEAQLRMRDSKEFLILTMGAGDIYKVAHKLVS